MRTSTWISARYFLSSLLRAKKPSSVKCWNSVQLIRLCGPVRRYITFFGISDTDYSTADGHFWPETYYLGTVQAREVMYEVRSYLLSALGLSER